MNSRRNFLRGLVGGVAVVAAVRTWPFRVYGFASELKIATVAEYVNYINFTDFASIGPAMAYGSTALKFVHPGPRVSYRFYGTLPKDRIIIQYDEVGIRSNLSLDA